MPTYLQGQKRPGLLIERLSRGVIQHVSELNLMVQVRMVFWRVSPNAPLGRMSENYVRFEVFTMQPKELKNAAINEKVFFLFHLFIRDFLSNPMCSESYSYLTN